VCPRRQREGDERRLTHRAIGNARSERTPPPLPRAKRSKFWYLLAAMNDPSATRRHRHMTARSNKASASDSGASRADGNTR
jgi:hypothetical protein